MPICIQLGIKSEHPQKPTTVLSASLRPCTVQDLLPPMDRKVRRNRRASYRSISLERLRLSVAKWRQE